MSGPILILGGTGMLGHKLWQVLSARRETHVAARSDYAAYEPLGLFDGARWHAGFDATRPEEIERVVRRVGPAAIVNCVGVVKQRAEANDPILATRVNALYPHVLSGIARAAGAQLIHLSTDCVFSGRRGRYAEDDLPDPPDLYGRSKLLGEVDAPGCLTLRTSMIGRELGTAHGLVEWFLSQAEGRVRGFAGAIFSGLPTIVLASLIADLLDREAIPAGVYHLASPPISKYDLLLLLRDAYGVAVEIEREEAFQCDRSLVGDRLLAATGLQVPSWPDMVQAMIADPTPYARWRERFWGAREVALRAG